MLPLFILNLHFFTNMVLLWCKEIFCLYSKGGVPFDSRKL